MRYLQWKIFIFYQYFAILCLIFCKRTLLLTLRNQYENQYTDNKLLYFLVTMQKWSQCKKRMQVSMQEKYARKETTLESSR